MSDDQSVLIAAMTSARVEELDLTVGGFTEEEFTAIAGALEIIVTNNIQENFGDVELVELGAWSLGERSTKLVAREVLVYPEAESLALGMQTNLRLPASAALEIDPTLPHATPMELQLSPGLLLGTSQRLLVEA